MSDFIQASQNQSDHEPSSRKQRNSESAGSFSEDESSAKNNFQQGSFGTVEGLTVTDKVPPIQYESFHKKAPSEKIRSQNVYYSEGELDQELKHFEKTKETPPEQMLNPMIQHIKRRRIEAIEVGNYDEAERLSQTQASLRSVFSFTIHKNQTADELKAIEERLKVARTELVEEEDVWEKKVKKLRQKHDESIQTILANHQIEEDEFNAVWGNPLTLHQFNKPSPQLIQLRSIEKRKALVGDFMGAKFMKKRADQLEKTETQEAQNKALLGMKEAYKQLQLNHRRELVANDRFTEQALIALAVHQNDSLLQFEMTVKKLELLLGHPPAPRQRKLVPLRSPDNSVPLLTPRTKERIRTFHQRELCSTFEMKAIPSDELSSKDQKIVKKPLTSRKPRNNSTF